MSKIKLEIFVPIELCGCYYSEFLDRVWSTSLKYRDHIEFILKSSLSEEAKKYNIKDVGIVINGTKKFIKNVQPEILEEAIRESILESKNVTN
jgi:translation initiation factor 2 beta subunit (eIF-2beta)/eIF-5